MRLIPALLLATVALPTLPVFATAKTAAAAPRGTNEQRFAALSQRYIDGIARFAPTYGTALGDHRFDDRIGDVSAAGRAAAVAHDRALLAELATIDRKQLGREAQVDAALLDNALRYELWQIEVLKNWRWDIQIYNDQAGGALYGLAARDFAPWPQRRRRQPRGWSACPPSSRRRAPRSCRLWCRKSTPPPSPSRMAV
ncbi:DUF885 family protein [Sphingomonas qilianensis]|uniref:DUF885 family protein n=1 Tax=Sphingomonas qilianensis TaxID=1736690 RepID=A0ABU9XV04_9SPHN